MSQHLSVECPSSTSINGYSPVLTSVIMSNDQVNYSFDIIAAVKSVSGNMFHSTKGAQNQKEYQLIQ